MEFIPVPLCYKVTVQYLEDSGVYGVNVFYNKVGLGGFDANAEVLNDLYTLWFHEQATNIITPNWRLNLIEVRDVNAADGRVTFFSGFGAPAGTAAGTPDALGIAMTVTWGTGYAGKSFRGRTFHLGLPEEQRTGRLWSDDMITAVATVYNELRERCDTADASLQVVSKFSDKVARTEAVTTPIITARANKPVHRQWKRMTAP